MSANGFRALPADQPVGFEIVGRERIADAFRPLEALTVRHERLSGGEAMEVRREVLRAGAAAIVLPYDPQRDAILVIRQFRIGAALMTPNAAPLELPAGHVDEGESPEAAARRELLEETGVTARALAHAFTILPSPGMIDEIAHVFLALVDLPDRLEAAGLAEENEDILPLVLPVDVLLQAADEGRISNGFLFAALNWFDRRGRAVSGTLDDSTGDAS